jgi:glycine cleavage system H protein
VALAMVALPVVAAVAFVARGLLLAAAVMVLVAGLAAYAVSPGFRSWFERRTEDQVSYSGLRLGTGLAFHPFHAWARIEGDEATVGADDLVQATLGPVEVVDMPQIGARVHQGEPVLQLYRDGRDLVLRSPVSGVVLSTNESLKWDPRQVNREPFGAGWLFRVRGENLKRERKTLLRGEEARAWFRREVDRLVSRLIPSAAPALPDGGVLVDELHRHIDPPHWDRLVEEFFGGEDRP